MSRPKTSDITFSSIIRGFSSAACGGGEIFFKHFGFLDSNNVNEIYGETYARAISLGVATEKEKLAQLREDSTWTEEDEKSIGFMKYDLAAMERTKRKLIMKSQINDVNAKIADCSAKIALQERLRSNHLGKTAESFAAKRSNEYFIYYSSYLDPKLEKPVCSIAEFDEWENDRLDEMVELYNRTFDAFDSYKIKSIAASSMCYNLISLCGEDTSSFYGRPVTSLTYLQVELLQLARYYHYIISSSDDIPDDIRDKPDRLEDWFGANQNAKNITDDRGDDGGSGTRMTTYVGVPEEDLEFAGIAKKGSTVNLASLIRDGKGMSLEQFEKL